jgi:hypothetical protein
MSALLCSELDDLVRKHIAQRRVLKLNGTLGFQRVRGDELTVSIRSMSPRALHTALELLRDAHIDEDNYFYDDFIVNGLTYDFVFADVDLSRRPRGIRHGIQHVSTRYSGDLLEASPEVRQEARLIAAVTNVLLEGSVRDGSANVHHAGGGTWCLRNDALVDLLQRRTSEGNRIIRVMREKATSDARLIEEILGVTQPLESGIL